MSATDLYHDLPKLARVQLPSGTSYALIDYNGRELIAPIFNTSIAFASGDYVIYQDELYQFTSAHAAGVWNVNQVRGPITVGDELNDLRNAIAGGVHYIGKTTTPIYDGYTTPIIIINGSSVTASTGDMVILDVINSNIATILPSGGDYSIQKNNYYKHLHPMATDTVYNYYIANTTADSDSWEGVEPLLDFICCNDSNFQPSGSSLLEFIWDGTQWNALGGATAYGDLAFKDSASGTYTKPTGTGSVNVAVYGALDNKLVTSTILGVEGTTTASKVTLGTAVNVASAGTAVRYGTADVSATAKTVATKSSTTHKYGTADVGTAIGVGTALSGTTSFNTDAIKSASLTGTQTFNTNAIKGAALTTVAGTGITVSQNGIVASVSGDCLTFGSATTTGLTITTTAADTGTVGITTSAATKASVGLSTTEITPATAAPSSQVFYEMGTTTVYEAVAAPNTQTIVPAVANGTITPIASVAEITVAVAASATKTFATGDVASDGAGATVLTQLTGTSVTKPVTVNTESGTVTVK